MTRIIYTIIIAIFMIHPHGTSAQTIDHKVVDHVVSKLQERYEGIDTVCARFVQKTLSKGLGRETTEMGRVCLKKPGMMRWVYETTGDVLVSDGRILWFYQADLNQVIKRDLSEEGTNIATDFLTGVGNIRRDFSVRLADRGEETYLLELKPREAQPGVERILLEVNREFIVTGTTVVDPLGNETIVTLDDIRINPPLERTLFEFKPPENVQVIED